MRPVGRLGRVLHRRATRRGPVARRDQEPPATPASRRGVPHAPRGSSPPRWPSRRSGGEWSHPTIGRLPRWPAWRRPSTPKGSGGPGRPGSGRPRLRARPRPPGRSAEEPCRPIRSAVGGSCDRPTLGPARSALRPLLQRGTPHRRSSDRRGCTGGLRRWWRHPGGSRLAPGSPRRVPPRRPVRWPPAICSRVTSRGAVYRRPGPGRGSGTSGCVRSPCRA